MKSIHINKLDNTMLSTTIDVRDTQLYNANHINGVKNIPMMGLILNHETFLDKNTTYYIMCQMGVKSKMAVSELLELGYDVINVDGGMISYQEK